MYKSAQVTKLDQELDECILAGDFDRLLYLLNQAELSGQAEKSNLYYYEQFTAREFDLRMRQAGKPERYFINSALLNRYFDLKSLKDAFAGQRCFIFADNGRLDDVNWHFLKDECVFGLNLLYASEMSGIARHWLIFDNKIACEAALPWLQANPQAKFFLPWHERGELSEEAIKPLFLNILDYPWPIKYPLFSPNLPTRLWTGAGSLYLYLQMALYMGFADIYVKGFESGVEAARLHELYATRLNALKGKSDAYNVKLREELSWKTKESARAQAGLDAARRVYERWGRRLHFLDAASPINASLKKGRGMKKAPAKAPAYEVSIIIPAYNCESTLERCLDSALAQYGLTPEIIVVNDGSTDNTQAICETYAAAFDNIKLINKTNAGLGSALNTGIDNASAPYLMSVDADDAIHHSMLINIWHKIKDEKHDFIRANWQRLKYHDLSDPSGYYATDICSQNGFEKLNQLYTLSFAGVLFSTKFINKNKLRFKEEIYHEDLHFMIRAHMCANSYGDYKSNSYKWHICKRSITHSKYSWHLDSFIYIINDTKELYEKKYGALDNAPGISLVFYNCLSQMTGFVNKIDVIPEKVAARRKMRKFVMANGFVAESKLDLAQTQAPDIRENILNHLYGRV